MLGEELPLTRLVARGKTNPPPRRSDAELAATFDDPTLLNERIERYLANRRLISAAAGAWGVRLLFVWQPVPTYRYDLRYHLFGDLDFEKVSYSIFGYPRMADLTRRQPLGPDFLWAADLQDGVQQPLYVDLVHYTARCRSSSGSRLDGPCWREGGFDEAGRPPRRPLAAVGHGRVEPTGSCLRSLPGRLEREAPQ